MAVAVQCPGVGGDLAEMGAGVIKADALADRELLMPSVPPRP